MNYFEDNEENIKAFELFKSDKESYDKKASKSVI
tara:strand:- start:104 stop:205 length:102 start_codon:yes stop_codon:yes gene_type:complete